MGFTVVWMIKRMKEKMPADYFVRFLIAIMVLRPAGTWGALPR